MSKILKLKSPALQTSPQISKENQNIPLDEQLRLSVPKASIEPSTALEKRKTNGMELYKKQPIAFRADELDEKQFEILAENNRLISLMEHDGLSPAAAKKHLGVERSARAIAQLYKRYKAEGKNALYDRRWYREPEKSVLTAELKSLILGFYYSFPAAGAGSIHRLVVKAINELNSEIEKEVGVQEMEQNGDDKLKSIPTKRKLRIPAKITVWRFLNELPVEHKMARTPSGIKEFNKQATSHVRFENTKRSNERWQVDHTQLNIWIRVRRDEKWIAVRVYLTLAIDVHSRAIIGFWISTKYPDSWSIKIMLWHAIMPKRVDGWRAFGVPRIIQCDCGADWLSRAVENTLAALGIQVDTDAPYYPNSKGKVERKFLSIDTSLLRALPGHYEAIGRSETSANKHIAELLTREQLISEFEQWIVNVDNKTIHAETERAPQELWEETVLGPVLPEEHELNILLLQHDVDRTIQSFGIKFKRDGVKHLFWHPEFSHHWRERVMLAYNPEDMESVLVYDLNRRFICEAWDMRAEKPRFTLTDVKKARREKMAEIRGLSRRNKEYMREIARRDRRSEQVKGWSKARQEAAKKTTEILKPTSEQTQLEAVLKMFRQMDSEPKSK